MIGNAALMIPINSSVGFIIRLSDYMRVLGVRKLSRDSQKFYLL
jgi:hypothetical protein